MTTTMTMTMKTIVHPHHNDYDDNEEDDCNEDDDNYGDHNYGGDNENEKSALLQFSLIFADAKVLLGPSSE